jgi:hypothetical protein
MRRHFLRSRQTAYPNTQRAGGSVQLMTGLATNRQSQNTNRRRESARLRFVNCCVVQRPCDSRAALLAADFVEITELEDDDARVEGKTGQARQDRQDRTGKTGQASTAFSLSRAFRSGDRRECCDLSLCTTCTTCMSFLCCPRLPCSVVRAEAVCVTSRRLNAHFKCRRTVSRVEDAQKQSSNSNTLLSEGLWQLTQP